MKRNIYHIAGALALCLAVSCTHKQLAEFGEATGAGQYEKDLKVIFDWSDPINENVDQQTSFESARDYFMSTQIRELSEHIMPIGQDYHIDTLVDVTSPMWNELRSEIYESTFFPAREYNHAHFAGVYDIFAITNGRVSILDTTSMSKTLPTNFSIIEDIDIETVPLAGGQTGTKATAQFEMVPGFNDLPTGTTDREGYSMEKICYGVKKGEKILPGKTEHEVHEVTVEMKTLHDHFLSLWFDGRLDLRNFIGTALTESWSGLVVTGMTANYDLLNGKAIDGYNYFRRGNRWFGTNRREYPNAVDIPTFGYSDEAGKIEACIFGCASYMTNDGRKNYFWYKKTDITDDVRNRWNPNERVLSLDLFEGGAVLPADAVSSSEENVVWNECN